MSRTEKDRNRPSTVAWVVFGIVLGLSVVISIGSFSSNVEQRIGMVYGRAIEQGASHEAAVAAVKDQAHADLYAIEESAAFFGLGGALAVAVLLISATTKSKVRTWLWATFSACLGLFFLALGSAGGMQTSPGASWPAAAIISAIVGGICSLVITVRTTSRRRKDKAPARDKA